jgi:hypothetical protein
MLSALILLGIDSEKREVVGDDCDTTMKNWSSLSGSGVEEGDLETAPSSESSVAFSRACRFALRLEKGGVESREVVDLLGGVEGAGGGEAERLVGFGDIFIFGSWLAIAIRMHKFVQIFFLQLYLQALGNSVYFVHQMLEGEDEAIS